MIFHIFLGDLQTEFDLKTVKFLKLIVTANDSKEFGVYSDEYLNSHLVKFNQTIHCPLDDAKTLIHKLEFKLQGISMDRSNQEFGGATLFCSKSENAITKSVIIHSKDEAKVGKLEVTLFYNKSPLNLGNESILENSYKPNEREYAFLLSRKMRQKEKKKPSSFNKRQEKTLVSDIYTQIPESVLNKTITLSKSYLVKPNIGSKKKKSNDPPRLRKTVMSVGYVNNNWPEMDSNLKEKQLYRLRLASEERLNLMREIEEEIKLKNKKKKVQQDRLEEEAKRQQNKNNNLNQSYLKYFKSVIQEKETENTKLKNYLKFLKLTNSASPSNTKDAAYKKHIEALRSSLNMREQGKNSELKPEKLFKALEEKEMSESRKLDASKDSSYRTTPNKPKKYSKRAKNIPHYMQPKSNTIEPNSFRKVKNVKSNHKSISQSKPRSKTKSQRSLSLYFPKSSNLAKKLSTQPVSDMLRASNSNNKLPHCNKRKSKLTPQNSPLNSSYDFASNHLKNLSTDTSSSSYPSSFHSNDFLNQKPGDTSYDFSKSKNQRKNKLYLNHAKSKASQEIETSKSKSIDWLLSARANINQLHGDNKISNIYPKSRQSKPKGQAVSKNKKILNKQNNDFNVEEQINETVSSWSENDNLSLHSDPDSLDDVEKDDENDFEEKFPLPRDSESSIASSDSLSKEAQKNQLNRSNQWDDIDGYYDSSLNTQAMQFLDTFVSSGPSTTSNNQVKETTQIELPKFNEEPKSLTSMSDENKKKSTLSEDNKRETDSEDYEAEEKEDSFKYHFQYPESVRHPGTSKPNIALQFKKNRDFAEEFEGRPDTIESSSVPFDKPKRPISNPSKILNQFQKNKAFSNTTQSEPSSSYPSTKRTLNPDMAKSDFNNEVNDAVKQLEERIKKFKDLSLKDLKKLSARSNPNDSLSELAQDDFSSDSQASTIEAGIGAQNLNQTYKKVDSESLGDLDSLEDSLSDNEPESIDFN